MARKDLSRTVIEGGRRYYNSHQRRGSHGIARAREREWLDHVCGDPDAADDTDPRPRKRVRKEFYDKLAPALRWLGSNVGRPWSKVFSELCDEFDTRTLAGRHVVHDHMLDWVDTGNDETHWRRRVGSRYYFYVDGHGILRRPAWTLKSYGKLRAETKAWAAGRWAALDHRGWWWYAGAATGKPCPSTYTCPCKHCAINYVNYHLLFRRHSKMTARDVTRLMQLPPELRKELVFEVGPVVRGRR